MTALDDVTQIITSIGVIVAVLNTWRNGQRLDTVHKAVNSTAMEQNARTDQLTAALTDASVEVPPRPPSITE